MLKPLKQKAGYADRLFFNRYVLAFLFTFAGYTEADLLIPEADGAVAGRRDPLDRTIIVTALGRVDPDVDIYQRDRGIMLDHLRADARKQCIEKAVGTMVSSRTLVQDYVLIEDQILSQTAGMIKSVVNEGAAVMGADGFMRMEMTAEVYLGKIDEVLSKMTRVERTDQIKKKGNPTIAVDITVRNASRKGPTYEERSELAENILKHEFADFGYRVWSDGEGQFARVSDFKIEGEVRFEYREAVVRGIKLPAHHLVSWTVKCQDGVTGEQLYFNNQVPRGKSWSSEAAAEEDVGRLIAADFTQEFFDRHLMSPSKVYQLYVRGASNYDSAQEVRAAFLGLRSVLRSDLRSFDVSEPALYEVEIAGERQDFLQLLDAAVLKPLNERYGRGYLSLVSTEGQSAELVLDLSVAALGPNSKKDGGLPGGALGAVIAGVVLAGLSVVVLRMKRSS